MSKILTKDSLTSFEKTAAPNVLKWISRAAPYLEKYIPGLGPAVAGTVKGATQNPNFLKELGQRLIIRPYEMGGNRRWNIKINTGGIPGAAAATKEQVESSLAPAFQRKKGAGPYYGKAEAKQEAFHAANPPQFHEVNVGRGGVDFTTWEQMMANQPQPKSWLRRAAGTVGTGAAGAAGLVGLAAIGGGTAAAATNPYQMP